MFKSLYEAEKTSPNDVVDGDKFVAKLVAAAGYNNDWALYWGPSDWSNEEVANNGKKLGEGEIPFGYLMQLRVYRP